jgi:periplasmic protein TonB
MLKNLIESKPRRARRAGGAVTSVVLHMGLIGAAVYGTLHAEQLTSKPVAEKVIFVQTRTEDPVPKTTPKPPPPSDLVAAPPPPKGFQVLMAPISIPNVLPAIDLSRKITDAADFTGRGTPGGTATGVPDGVAPPNLGETFRDFQVDKQVSMMPGALPPHYPDAMRAANVEGDVLVSFVVDTTGRADMSTLKVVRSTHESFSQAVRTSVANTRYYPAEIGAHKVKQLVQQPFVFSLTGRR